MKLVRTKLKFHYSMKGRLGWQGLKADEYQSNGPYVVSSAHFHAGRIAWDACPSVTEQRYAMDANIQLRIGDVLLMKDGAALGKLAYVHDLSKPACVNSHLLVLRPTDGRWSTRFLYYLLDAKPFQDYMSLHGKGSTFLGVSQESIGTFSFTAPNRDAQAQIAEFLDRKTAAIDALVAKKERLLALLAERRAALVHQAVTKGLDPAAPMKDSGVPWIGSAPTDWSVAPLYSRYTVQLGKMLDAARQTGLHDAPYLRNADIQWDEINTDDLKYMDFTPAEREKYALRAGDILMCEGGANASVVGRSAVWDAQRTNVYYQKALHRLRATGVEQSRFLMYALWAASDCGAFVADSNANIFHITAEKLRVMRFPFPPPKEQARIVTFIDTHRERLTALDAALRAQIARLLEYRQALITAAVTGQLDPTLPEPHPSARPTSSQLPLFGATP